VNTPWHTLDEWHLVFHTPAGLPAPAVRRVRRVLADRRFLARPLSAVRAVIRPARP
jgi:hypothetical protein